jgi:hypothetical protein
MPPRQVPPRPRSPGPDYKPGEPRLRFPHPTDKRPHTNVANDEVNVFLGTLRVVDTGHADLAKTLKETLQQKGGEYEAWEGKELEGVAGKSAQEIHAYMTKEYAAKLKIALKDAKGVTRAMIGPGGLAAFLEAVQVLLDEIEDEEARGN